MSKKTPQELAQACAEVMWSDDNASQNLGMRIDHIAPGEAGLSMVVRDDMTNGHSICHGGFIFTLADSAFAFACNGYNQRSVGQQVNITYVAPAYKGDQLLAAAREVLRQPRSGIYDVTVTNQNEDIIAIFRGQSRTVKGVHLPDQE